MSETNPQSNMVIRDVAPGITTLSVPASQLGINFGGRATIVRLATGNLAVFSPVGLTPAAQEKVKALGIVRYLVALDYEHHLYLSAWAKAYPDAQIIGPEGLREKREKKEATKGTSFAHVFTKANPITSISEEFDAELEHEYVHSHANREIVFLHKPSRTLIEADLIFNLPATEQYPKGATGGFLNRLLGGLLQTQGTMTAQKRVLWYGLASKDRAGFAASMNRIQAWDFDRIIPCHGDVIDTGGKKVFGTLMKDYLAMKV